MITGVFDDWLYDHFGLFGWTVEIWSPHRQAGVTEGFSTDTKPGSFKFIDWHRDHPADDDLKMLKWSDEALGGTGYVDWYPYDHPQLGRVARVRNLSNPFQTGSALLSIAASRIR